jgi:hypothetical protein
MTRISLSAVINESFINRFRGIAADQRGSQSPLATGGAEAPTISEGLRVGARTFASAVQTLNSGIAVLNASDNSLKILGNTVEEMLTLADQASSSATQTQTRHRLNLEFKELVFAFQDAVKTMTEGEVDFLESQDIAQVLTNIGLDPEESNEIGELFKQLVLSEGDDLLVNQDIQGQGQAPMPSTLANQRFQSVAERSLFDPATNILSRESAFEVLHDLKALKGQIDTNQEVVQKLQQKISLNLDLVRAVGLSFLSTSEQITSIDDATTVAKRLRSEIRKDAGAALSQAENLEPIVVAALAYDSSDN